jgi:nicotinate-nucleotide adenylyltransferase
MDYTGIIEYLKENLTEEKFSHSLGTAQCAKELAHKFNLDEEKAYLAGLLHDCAKGGECPAEVELTELERNAPKTVHAPAGAHLAREKFNITDPEILSAIRWHTIGNDNMTDFEKIIFIADKIEPNTRSKDFTEKILALLDEENGLDKAMSEFFTMRKRHDIIQ